MLLHFAEFVRRDFLNCADGNGSALNIHWCVYSGGQIGKFVRMSDIYMYVVYCIYLIAFRHVQTILNSFWHKKHLSSPDSIYTTQMPGPFDMSFKHPLKCKLTKYVRQINTNFTTGNTQRLKVPIQFPCSCIKISAPRINTKSLYDCFSIFSSW